MTGMNGGLEKQDADDWVYRGEGGANIVLGYTGSSPNFVMQITVSKFSFLRKTNSAQLNFLKLIAH